jgi:hypothetical protein
VQEQQTSGWPALEIKQKSDTLGQAPCQRFRSKGMLRCEPLIESNPPAASRKAGACFLKPGAQVESSMPSTAHRKKIYTIFSPMAPVKVRHIKLMDQAIAGTPGA